MIFIVQSMMIISDKILTNSYRFLTSINYRSYRKDEDLVWFIVKKNFLKILETRVTIPREFLQDSNVVD